MTGTELVPLHPFFDHQDVRHSKNCRHGVRQGKHESVLNCAVIHLHLSERHSAELLLKSKRFEIRGDRATQLSRRLSCNGPLSQSLIQRFTRTYSRATSEILFCRPFLPVQIRLGRLSQAIRLRPFVYPASHPKHIFLPIHIFQCSCDTNL